jgi:hypothetical protein
MYLTLTNERSVKKIATKQKDISINRLIKMSRTIE